MLGWIEQLGLQGPKALFYCGLTNAAYEPLNARRYALWLRRSLG